jgi:hypothetical protein
MFLAVDGKGKFSHILRVYLIDQRSQIRNIYNLSFLHPDILVNDVKTLMMEHLPESFSEKDLMRILWVLLFSSSIAVCRAFRRGPSGSR